MNRGVALSSIYGMVRWAMGEDARRLVPPHRRDPWVLATTHHEVRGTLHELNQADDHEALIAATPSTACPPCSLGPLAAAQDLVSSDFTDFLAPEVGFRYMMDAEEVEGELDRIAWVRLRSTMLANSRDVTLWQTLQPHLTGADSITLGQSAIGQTTLDHLHLLLGGARSGPYVARRGYSLAMLALQFGPAELESLLVRTWTENVQLSVAEAHRVLSSPDPHAPLEWLKVLAK